MISTTCSKHVSGPSDLQRTSSACLSWESSGEPSPAKIATELLMRVAENREPSKETRFRLVPGASESAWRGSLVLC